MIKIITIMTIQLSTGIQSAIDLAINKITNGKYSISDVHNIVFSLYTIHCYINDVRYIIKYSDIGINK